MNANQNKKNVKKENQEATYIRCPYDPRHYVHDRFYESHLVSCSQRNPHINVIICPYNGFHRCRNIESMVHWIFNVAHFLIASLQLNFDVFRIVLDFFFQSKHIEDCQSQEQFVDRNFHMNSSTK